MTTQTIRRDGYFTWLSRLYGLDCGVLEHAIGFSFGSLRNGWKLFTPRLPLAAGNIDLRGSTRYSNGVMPDGRQIADVLAGRMDVSAAREKVASYFDRGLDRRPVKVLPNLNPTDYPPARAVSMPQFKLLTEVEWVFVLEVAPGTALTRAAALGARW